LEGRHGNNATELLQLRLNWRHEVRSLDHNYLLLPTAPLELPINKYNHREKLKLYFPLIELKFRNKGFSGNFETWADNNIVAHFVPPTEFSPIIHRNGIANIAFLKESKIPITIPTASTHAEGIIIYSNIDIPPGNQAT
jgi:hypothetical protein